jgi:hypothetical protein
VLDLNSVQVTSKLNLSEEEEKEEKEEEEKEEKEEEDER